MKHNGSAKQVVNYDLMSAIYCLSEKCGISLVLGVSPKFFSSTKICDVLKFLHFTCVVIDPIFDKERTNGIYWKIADYKKTDSANLE